MMIALLIRLDWQTVFLSYESISAIGRDAKFLPAPKGFLSWNKGSPSEFKLAGVSIETN